MNQAPNGQELLRDDTMTPTTPRQRVWQAIRHQQPDRVPWQFGYKPVAVFGFIQAAVCILLFARSKSYAATLVSCLLFGFGAMALNTAGNTLIPRVFFDGKDPAAASNLGNVAFGVGLLLAPLIVSYLFRKTSYENTVSALAALMVVAVVPAALADYPKSEVAFEFAKTLDEAQIN